MFTTEANIYLSVAKRLLILAFPLVMLTPNVAGADTVRTDVCHLPPGNKSNFHTITVSEKALPAHLQHGDISGSCSDSAQVLCNDGDACTVDAMDSATEMCRTDHPRVNCDDSNVCTTDSCNGWLVPWQFAGDISGQIEGRRRWRLCFDVAGQQRN